MDKGQTDQKVNSQWSEHERWLITQGQHRIKAKMPEVYKTILRYAEKDKSVWGIVRMGLTGRPDYFWACEGGEVVGAPFTRFARAVEVSRLIGRMGCAHVCMIAGHGDLGGT
ncbi:hypothetical protein [Comamonas sp. Tr-654]|uniref:hypothetical protein n=1 Tax=Comamonas sp. Tr-654 TaxID=2608341 RepID=UPI0014222625|nr:hypothetical protein [Comamonas sp. Tr-654]